MVNARVEEITQIIDLDKNKLKKFETLKTEFNLKCTDKTYQKLKETICETNKRTIQPSILKRLNINTKWEFNKKIAVNHVHQGVLPPHTCESCFPQGI